MRNVRYLAVLLVLLVGGLIAQALWDSAIGAWVAIGALFAIALVRLVGWIGIWPSDWPDDFGG